MDNQYNNDNLHSEISKTIFQIQEDERNRIARDLHDSSLQDLTYILHKLELLGLYMEQDAEKANLELNSIKQHLRNTINDIRNVIFDLRPTTIDDLGLKESLDVFFQWLRKDTNFGFDIDLDIIDADRIILLNIYRIIVECVMNAVKYSEGTEIIVRCNILDEGIKILIQDDGIGFEENIITDKNYHYGLSIVKERVRILGGTITIATGIGNGSKIDIFIPL